MQKYQERVVAERDELLDKFTKLAKFVYSERALSLSSMEKERMQKQLYIMLEYIKILTERISAFKK